MISIRRRMTLLVCGGIALLLLGGGVALYWTIRAVLTAQFDATLAAKAQALIVAADLDDARPGNRPQRAGIRRVRFARRWRFL